MRTRSMMMLPLALSLMSCTTVHDWRGPSDVCEVHQVRMRSVSVPALLGISHFAEEYAQARLHSFPHIPPEGSSTIWKRELVYVCDACISARKAWLRNHPWPPTKHGLTERTFEAKRDGSGWLVFVQRHPIEFGGDRTIKIESQHTFGASERLHCSAAPFLI